VQTVKKRQTLQLQTIDSLTRYIFLLTKPPSNGACLLKNIIVGAAVGAALVAAHIAALVAAHIAALVAALVAAHIAALVAALVAARNS